MLSILAFDDPPPQSAPDEGSRREEEFELVVGRRQMAAIAFVGLVIVAVCSGTAYLVGKALADEATSGQATAAREDVQPLIKLEPAPAPLPSPTIEATIVVPPASVPPASVPPARPARSAPAVAPKLAAETPLFASPVPKAIYIQVGAVEKGVATVIAEGLRKHALDAFIAPGPSEKVFRVLIGPFPDAETYQKAQNIVDQIGLASFARRYQQQ